MIGIAKDKNNNICGVYSDDGYYPVDDDTILIALRLYHSLKHDGTMPDTESTRLKKARKEARRFKRKYTNLKTEYERYRASTRVKKYKVVKLNKLILKQRNQTDRKG